MKFLYTKPTTLTPALSQDEKEEADMNVEPTTLTLAHSLKERGKAKCFLLSRQALTLTAMLLAGTALSGGWYWEVGAAGRSSIDFKMQSDSYVRLLNLQAARPSHAASSRLAPNSPLLPDALGPGSRTFDDGTVAPDAMSFLFGDTENWSFGSMSQYDSKAQTLTFHTSSDVWTGGASERRTSVASENTGLLRDDDDDWQFGIEAKLGYQFYEKDNLTFGLQGAIRFFGESEASLKGTVLRQTIVTEQSATVLTRQEHWSYTYDADFGGPQLIAPRPEGTTGPLYLPVAPLGRDLDGVDETTETLLNSRTVRHAQSDVRLDAEIQLTQLALGPTLELTLPRGFMIGVSPYLTLNMLDFSATRTEVFAFTSGATIASWRDDADDTKVKLGAGVDAYLGYKFAKSWMAFATVGYEDSFDKATLTVGPGKIDADLSSFRFSSGVRYSF